ncbi:hypothetical protein Zm00014a_022791 [Zea mays]|uniref:Pectin acetylesterase n=2 Tax=Zea mays TaxID=4577 RepID=A0A3L6EIW4_MAIZE|nr:Pectin acetylesterase 8 [Zea mays]PWZ21000.1 hypothetical protein Zm00014a_022791 [Zea mays]
MADGSLYAWWCCALGWALALVAADGFLVDITYVESAVAKGAVCLDGSAPAYHLARGSGSGENSWLVHFEGGGWCNNVTTCLQRKRTRLGSSKEMATQIAFSGILSDTPDDNPASNAEFLCKPWKPDFYNWNKVKVRYCDGSSFTGDVEEVDPATKLHYRGARIWQAVMDDLLAKGMDKAENVCILTSIVLGNHNDFMTFCRRLRGLSAFLMLGSSLMRKTLQELGTLLPFSTTSLQHISPERIVHLLFYKLITLFSNGLGVSKEFAAFMHFDVTSRNGKI